MSGLLPCVTLLTPRRRNVAPAPGWPELASTLTPVLAAASNCCGLEAAVRAIASVSMVAMAVPTARRFSSPVAVTTTPLRAYAARVSWNETLAPSAVTVTVCSMGSKPMNCARTLCTPSGTPRMVKAPCALTAAPIRVPTTVTCAASIGRSDPRSTTVPVTVPVVCWAPNDAAAAKRRMGRHQQPMPCLARFHMTWASPKVKRTSHGQPAQRRAAGSTLVLAPPHPRIAGSPREGCPQPSKSGGAYDNSIEQPADRTSR